MNERNPAEYHKPIEAIREEMKTRLNSILFKPLAVENIEIFADQALDEIMILVNDILNEYDTNPSIEKNPLLDPKQKEDDACAQFDLPNIQNILQSIIDVRDRIEGLKQNIAKTQIYTETVITPPLRVNNQIPIGGHKNPFEKNTVPRFLTLMYILQTDCGIDTSDTSKVMSTKGQVAEEMMREEPYIRVVVPELNRVVYVCDEEDNISYVFNLTKLSECNIKLEELDIKNKKEKDQLITNHPGIGVRVKQTTNWRTNMRKYLDESLPEKIIVTEVSVPQSEFTPRPSFEDWSNIIKEEWNKIDESSRPLDIAKWYTKLRQNFYPGFPSLSSLYQKRVYPEKFIDIHSIIGIENKQRKVYINFDEFKAQLIEAWVNRMDKTGTGFIYKWYNDQRKNPSYRDVWPEYNILKKLYAKNGFTSLNATIGIPNHLERTYLSFPAFREQVTQAWVSREVEVHGSNIQNWYRAECKKHSDWPSNPFGIYKEHVQKWRELVK